MRLGQTYEGAASYDFRLEVDGHELLVSIRVTVEGLPGSRRALLDTGCPWCILPGALVALVGSEPIPGDPRMEMSTRLGRFRGWLDRLRLSFAADYGEPVEIEASWFICPDWPGPMVVGWQGGLERIHFALDTTNELFYFAR